MTTYEPWIGENTTSTGNDCRARWAPGWPPCGAPATIHIMSESAIDGVVSLGACEKHAPLARAAGVYVDEHSPSYPGCQCRPARPPAPAPCRTEVQPCSTGRAPFNPANKARFFARNSLFITAESDGYIHHMSLPTRGVNHGLCGKDLTQALHSTDWQIIDCPTCRVTETP